MKKKLGLLLSAFAVAFALCACGSDPKTVDYNGMSYDEIYTQVQSYIENVNAIAQVVEQRSSELDSADYSRAIEKGNLPETVLEALGLSEDKYAEAGLDAAQVAAATAWMDTAEEFGGYKSVAEDSFSITKSGNTTTADITLKFENEAGQQKDVTFEAVYKTWNMELTGISISPVQTLGEKMSNAGLNTVISMGVVFLVLIVISLLIYAFNIFPYLEKKKKEKNNSGKTDNAAEAIATTAVVEEPVGDETDDLELVAVIAAAIAAAEGRSTSDFVVRSINRR